LREKKAVCRVEFQKIGFIGCGNMGKALVKSVVENKVFPSSSVYVADIRKELLGLSAEIGVNETDNISLAKKCDIIILAVKPKDVKPVIEEIECFINERKLIISIAAGVSTSTIESFLKNIQIPIVRVMPNLNVKVNAGLLPYCLGRYASKYKELIEKIFAFSGFVFELKEEKFDAVTAISGSGPGFIFFIAEIIESVCRAKNFTAEEADLISAHIIYGSGKMLVDTKTAPKVLKEMVSSPKGTTLAGLNVFVERGLKDIFEEAIDKAETRSRELSKEFEQEQK